MCYFCVSVSRVLSLILYIGLMWSYGSTKWTEFNLGLWWEIVTFEGPDIDVSIFLLKYFGLDICLFLFGSSCSIDAFFFINNGPLKGRVYKFLIVLHQ